MPTYSKVNKDREYVRKLAVSKEQPKPARQEIDESNTAEPLEETLQSQVEKEEEKQTPIVSEEVPRKRFKKKKKKVYKEEEVDEQSFNQETEPQSEDSAEHS